jgi:hypothetical protein
MQQDSNMSEKAPCRLINTYLRLSQACCLNLQSVSNLNGPLFTIQHGIILPKLEYLQLRCRINSRVKVSLQHLSFKWYNLKENNNSPAALYIFPALEFVTCFVPVKDLQLGRRIPHIYPFVLLLVLPSYGYTKSFQCSEASLSHSAGRNNN